MKLGVGMLEGVCGSESFVPHVWIMERTYPAVPVCMSIQTYPFFTTDISDLQFSGRWRPNFYTNWGFLGFSELILCSQQCLWERSAGKNISCSSPVQT